MRFTVKATGLVGPLEIAAAAKARTWRVCTWTETPSPSWRRCRSKRHSSRCLSAAAKRSRRGTTSVPTSALLKIAKARKGETLEVLSDEEGRLVVRTAGPTYQLVAGKEGTEARSPNHAHGAVIPDFAEAWRFIRHAVSKDGTRPHLAGPAIDLRSGRLFATDGHRAAIARVFYGTLDVDPVVVHWGLVAVIDKVIKHVSEARFETSCVHVLRFPGVSVWWCSSLDVRPPPIDKVIPDAASARRVVRFDALTALAAIKEVTLLAPPRGGIQLRVRLGSAKGTLEYENDGSTTTCAIPIAGEGDAVSFLVNPHYLSDALASFASSGDEVSFRVSGPKEAMVITRGDFLALIMSMKE